MANLEVGGYIFLRIDSGDGVDLTADFGHLFLRYTADDGSAQVVRSGGKPLYQATVVFSRMPFN